MLCCGHNEVKGACVAGGRDDVLVYYADDFVIRGLRNLRWSVQQALVRRSRSRAWRNWYTAPAWRSTPRR